MILYWLVSFITSEASKNLTKYGEKLRPEPPYGGLISPTLIQSGLNMNKLYYHILKNLFYCWHGAPCRQALCHGTFGTMI